MAAPTLISISPLAGPPGTVVTCVGTGFAPGSQVGCPTLVPTTYVDAQTVTAAIPEVAGPAGGSMMVGVFVVNGDGTSTGVLAFTVQFPATALQTWTSIEAVCGEVNGFARGGKIGDAQIQRWIESIAQSIAGAMLRRGLSLDPADWQQPSLAASPSPAGCLEMINRLGAAERLAASIAAQFGGSDWAVRRNLAAAYGDEMKSLTAGGYDKLFKPTAATVESGPLLSAGDVGCPSFTKEKVF
jgi:hypothetical protein